MGKEIGEQKLRELGLIASEAIQTGSLDNTTIKLNSTFKKQGEDSLSFSPNLYVSPKELTWHDPNSDVKAALIIDSKAGSWKQGIVDSSKILIRKTPKLTTSSDYPKNFSPYKNEQTILEKLNLLYGTDKSSLSTSLWTEVGFYTPWIDGFCLWDAKQTKVNEAFTKLELPRKLRLLGLLAEQLKGIHKKGVIHRNIRPSNILIDLNEIDPALDSVAIINFGASVTTENKSEKTILHNPYSIKEKDEINDESSDIASLCLTMLEVLKLATQKKNKKSYSLEIQQNTLAQLFKISDPTQVNTANDIQTMLIQGTQAKEQRPTLEKISAALFAAAKELEVIKAPVKLKTSIPAELTVSASLDSILENMKANDQEISEGKKEKNIEQKLEETPQVNKEENTSKPNVDIEKPINHEEKTQPSELVTKEESKSVEVKVEVKEEKQEVQPKPTVILPLKSDLKQSQPQKIVPPDLSDAPERNLKEKKIPENLEKLFDLKFKPAPELDETFNALDTQLRKNRLKEAAKQKREPSSERKIINTHDRFAENLLAERKSRIADAIQILKVSEYKTLGSAEKLTVKITLPNSKTIEQTKTVSQGAKIAINLYERALSAEEKTKDKEQLWINVQRAILSDLENRSSFFRSKETNAIYTRVLNILNDNDPYRPDYRKNDLLHKFNIALKEFLKKAKAERANSPFSFLSIFFRAQDKEIKEAEILLNNLTITDELQKPGDELTKLLLIMQFTANPNFSLEARNFVAASTGIPHNHLEEYIRQRMQSPQPKNQ